MLMPSHDKNEKGKGKGREEDKKLPDFRRREKHGMPKFARRRWTNISETQWENAKKGNNCMNVNTAEHSKQKTRNSTEKIAQRRG